MPRDTIQPTQPATPSAPALVDPQLPPLEALKHSHRLELSDVLGRGGMGEVRIGRDAHLGRQLAVKTSTTDDLEATQRFVREARVQGQLEHPGIVPVHELGLGTDDRPYFTMKRVRGVTLSEVLRRLQDGDGSTLAQFPRRRLLSVLQSLSQTLDFAHSRGVVHRDVKPANVMLGDFGEVYLLDWGLAKVTREDALAEVQPVAARRKPPREPGLDDTISSGPGVTVAGAVMGTPGYMAPEQAAGKPASPESDVWALGVLLFEAVAGRRLIDAPNAIEALVATQELQRPSLRAFQPDVSPELEALCQAALAPEPRGRPTARAFGERLEQVLAGERDVALRATLAERHADAADAATRRALETGSLDARREALREVGQALALEPGLTRAHDTFGRLLATTPAEPPPEVELELAASQLDAEKSGIRNGLVAHLVTGALLLPTVFWVRDAALFSMLIATWLVTTLFTLWLWRLPRTRAWHRLVGIALAAAINACLAFVAGPFIVVPSIATANAMGMTLWMPKRERVPAVLVQLAAVFVPLGLSALGVIAPFYEVGGGGVLVKPLMLHMSEAWWSLAMCLSVLGTVISAAVVMQRTRDEVEAARRELTLQRWNLEQLRAASLRPPDAGA